MRNSPGGTQAMPAGVCTPSPTMISGAAAAGPAPAFSCHRPRPARGTRTGAAQARRGRLLVNRIRRRAGSAEVFLDDGRIQRVGQAVEYAVDLEVIYAGQAPGVRYPAPFVEIATVHFAIQVAITTALGVGGENVVHLRF